MLDLIAITAGLLAFIGWSGLMLFGGYAARKRAEQRAQARRIAALLADAKAASAPAKVELAPGVRRRAQA